MHKLKSSVILVGLILLSACGSETISEAQEAGAENPLKPSSKIVFAPENGDLSIPNDLLFSNTSDGTLNLPVDDATNFSDPTVAVSALDGWSLQQPFAIEFTLPTGVASLDAQTVKMPGSVRIFNSVMGASQNPNYPECASVTQGYACKVLDELTYGVDFVTQLTGPDTIVVIPLKPFNTVSNYLVVVTNQIEDSNQQPVQMAPTYQLARQNIQTHPLATEAQLGLQALINSFETALENYGVDLNSVILTSAMTTQSGRTLANLKALLVQNPASMPVISQPENTGFNVKDVLFPQTDTCPDMLTLMQSGQATNEQIMQISSVLPFCINQVYSADIVLPYYSGVASANNPLGATGKDAWWQARCDSGVTLLGAQATGVEIPANAQSENDSACMTFGLRDLSLDTERHLTQYNPIPKVTQFNDINVQITIPDPVYLSATGANITQMPAEGWPVVILQHGIGSQKEHMLALTGALGRAGFATVAIDMTLHGSRGFDINEDNHFDIQANANDVTAFMNLENSLATRDNLRQATVDLLGLRLGLANLAQTEFNQQKLDNNHVYFVGHSLGGITGFNFTALTNTPLATTVDPLFKIKASVFANTSGGIANFLLDSNSFGAFIKGSILLANFKPFITYEADKGTNFSGLLADQSLYQTEKSTYLEQANYTENDLILFEIAEQYFLYLAQAGVNVIALTADDHRTYFNTFIQLQSAANQSLVNGLINQFAFAMQTVLDSGDPNRYVEQLKLTETPILLTEIWGDGTPATWDGTIPPKANGSPISGTEGLANLLGLMAISETTSATDTLSGLIRFNSGGHSSLLSTASDPAVTVEMQTLIATYLASQAKLIKITNSAVIAD